MPHPAHLCVAFDCKFHLATVVGDHIISTVGEWFPQEQMLQIIADQKGITITGKGDERRYQYLNKVGFQEIGLNRKYETMVFKATPTGESKCCPFEISGPELQIRGYNEPDDATDGHYEMCEQWSNK